MFDREFGIKESDGQPQNNNLMRLCVTKNWYVLCEMNSNLANADRKYLLILMNEHSTK